MPSQGDNSKAKCLFKAHLKF